MRKLLVAVYSTLAYVFFLGVFLYAIGFVENLTPKSIDSGGGCCCGSSSSCCCCCCCCCAT